MNGTLKFHHSYGCERITMTNEAARRLASPADNDPFKWETSPPYDGEIQNLLHGHWEFDQFSASDRSLKENIKGMMATIQDRSRAGVIGLSWEQLLDHLNPVSYTYKTDSQLKTRLGFIADEMETVLPEVVKTTSAGRKGIVYLDLVAVLTTLAKGMFEDMSKLTAQLGVVETRIQQRKAWKKKKRKREKARRRAAGTRPAG